MTKKACRISFSKVAYMEQLYKEMQERLRYLEAQEQTEEIKWRIESRKV
jgi:hypothetical protein